MKLGQIQFFCCSSMHAVPSFGKIWTKFSDWLDKISWFKKNNATSDTSRFVFPCHFWDTCTWLLFLKRNYKHILLASYSAFWWRINFHHILPIIIQPFTVCIYLAGRFNSILVESQLFSEISKAVKIKTCHLGKQMQLWRHLRGSISLVWR